MEPLPSTPNDLNLIGRHWSNPNPSETMFAPSILYKPPAHVDSAAYTNIPSTTTGSLIFESIDDDDGSGDRMTGVGSGSGDGWPNVNPTPNLNLASCPTTHNTGSLDGTFTFQSPNIHFEGSPPTTSSSPPVFTFVCIDTDLEPAYSNWNQMQQRWQQHQPPQTTAEEGPTTMLTGTGDQFTFSPPSFCMLHLPSRLFLL